MSQPPGLFSVRRPRETLGPIQNYSGIPQPASAIKRPSSSTELRNAPYTAQHVRSTSINHNIQRPAQPNFHRSSSGGNLADMGMSTARRSAVNPFGSAAGHRQSLAPNQLFGSQTPASGSIQRRSSIYSRPSGTGSMGQQGFFSQPAGPPIKRADPRANQGKAYRERMSQELMEYLTQNNFELDMKHSLRPTATTSPTQNDFNLMFQWLYKRVDPSYKFQRAIEVELPQLMKQLRYPFGTDISKSHIYPITPQHWPKFLLMFHWLMQLAQMLDNFTRGAYDDACAEAGVDVAGDRIVFRFLFSAYQDWLQVSPDQDDDAADAALEPHRLAMNEEFERINVRHAEELKVYEAENESLRAQIEEIEKSMPDVAKLDKHFKILEDDKKKFEDYNATVQAKIEKYESRTKILEAEIAKTEAELEQAERERSSLQQSVDKQGLNIQEIDRMNTERERLTKSHDDAVATLEEVNKLVLDKEAETSRKLEDLESITKRYNSLGYQMSLIPSSAANAKGQEYELHLNLSQPTNFSTSQSRRRGSPSQDTDRLLAGPNVGYSPTHLLNLDLRGLTRNSLISLRKEINERRRHAADTAINDRELIDSVSEILQEKRAEIDSLNHHLTQAKELYTQLKDDHNTSYMQMTSKREKTEKELARMKDGLDRGLADLEQREMEVQLAYESMREEANKVRDELHMGVERTLEDVIRFKLHIKEGLEQFEAWVADEVEAELLGDGGVNDEFESETTPDGEVFE